SDASAKEVDFTLRPRFDLPVTFTNNGDQPHELQIYGVRSGKTAADVAAAFRSPGGGAGGPPPYTGVGGGAVIGPGKSEVIDFRLAPGTYFAMCFVTDPKTKAPHFALGMMKQFEVN